MGSFLSNLFKPQERTVSTPDVTSTQTSQQATERNPFGAFGGGFNQLGQNFGNLAGQDPNNFFAGLNQNQLSGIAGQQGVAGANPFLQGASGALNAGLGFQNPFTAQQGALGGQAAQAGIAGLQQPGGATGGFFGGPTFEPGSFGGPGTNFGSGTQGQGQGDFQTAGFQTAFDAAADPLFERFETGTLPGILSGLSQGGRLRGGGGLGRAQVGRSIGDFARGLGQATAPFALASSQQAADRNFQAQQNQFGRQFTGDQSNLGRQFTGEQAQFGRQFTGDQQRAERARITQEAGLGRGFAGQESAQARALAANQSLAGQGFAGLGNAAVGARGDVGQQLGALSGISAVEGLRAAPSQRLLDIGGFQQQQEQAQLNQPFAFGNQLNTLGAPGLQLSGTSQTGGGTGVQGQADQQFFGPSTFAQFAGPAASLAGTLLGGPAGGAIGGALGNVFSGGGFGGGGQAGFNPAEFSR